MMVTLSTATTAAAAATTAIAGTMTTTPAPAASASAFPCVSCLTLGTISGLGLDAQALALITIAVLCVLVGLLCFVLGCCFCGKDRRGNTTNNRHTRLDGSSDDDESGDDRL